MIEGKERIKERNKRRGMEIRRDIVQYERVKI